MERDRPCVVITHNFDPEVIVYEYDSDEEAGSALKRLYEKYLAEEKANESLLDEDECFCDENYARVTWIDEWSRTEFHLATIWKEV